MTKPTRSPYLLSRATSALLVIDIQEKLVPAIAEKETMIARTILALRGAKIVEVPILVTEQYPKGLGRTVPEIAALVGPAMEKVCFSSCAAEGVLPALSATNAKQVVIVGMEAHVCVLQTALDLLANGFSVFIAADAVGSRRLDDKHLALARMSHLGITIASAESVVFEWTEGANHPRFREISQLIKETQGP